MDHVLPQEDAIGDNFCHSSNHKMKRILTVKCLFSYSLKYALVDFYRDLQKIILPGEKIMMVSAGFSHSLFYTAKNKLFAIGLNNFGQCGQSSLNRTSVKIELIE